MPMITVVKPFTLQLDPLTRKVKDPTDPTKEIEETLPTELRFFEVGVFDVEDRLAEHWYVKAHLKGYEPPAVVPGMAEFQVARAVEQAKIDDGAPMDPSQPMPSDARAPRRAQLPPNVRRAEPIA